MRRLWLNSRVARFRFILNEIDMVSFDKSKRHIEQVILTIGKALNYSIIDIKKLLFMEIMLANVWPIEDGGRINGQQISLAMDLI